MPEPLYALSVIQPWAWLLLHGKDVENRDWPLPNRFRGVRVAIHASKKRDRDEWDGAAMVAMDASLAARIPSMAQLSYGAIIGTLIFERDLTHSPSPWFFGEHGFLVRDPIELPQQIPCKGALGFWRVPDEIAAAIGPHGEMSAAADLTK